MGIARQNRAHAWKILSGFAKMPTINQWWPLPNDEEHLRQTEPEPTELSAKQFVSLFGAAFRQN